jgi:hypothetical protein
MTQITNIKNQIRNPYSHLRYKEIFKGKTTPVARIKFKLPSDAEKDPLEQDFSQEKNDGISLHQLDLGLEPSISAIFKETYDKQLAFKLSWDIYALYWLLLELYLSPEKYDNYIRTVGSFVEKLPPLKKNE